MSDVVTSGMDIDMDVAMSVPGSAVYTGTGGGLMSIFTDGVTCAEMPSLIQPNFNSPSGYHAAATLPICVFAHTMDVDIEFVNTTPDNAVCIGTGGGLMSKLHHPIRPNLAALIEPHIDNDHTTVQFTDIADIIATNMDVDTDLPAGASGGWGCAMDRGGVYIPGSSLKWSFDQFGSVLKTENITEIEYISASGIPSYVVLGTDDPNAGDSGRDAEDVRLLDVADNVLVELLALASQWTEIIVGGGPGSASASELEILTFSFI
jgi:hypothetical protein